MAIPDYQSIMLPLLRLASDGAPHRLSEAIDTLATQFELTQEERVALLPSGRQSAFANRVGWARTYLSKAGLLDNSQRGIFSITDRGRNTLLESVDRVDRRYLKRFAEFSAFIGGGDQEGEGTDSPDPQFLTPEERFESAYLELRRALAQELLSRIKSNTPAYFERLVVDVIVAMGYGGSRPDAGRAIGMTGDGGIDGVVYEDVLGLDVIYLQAKRWEGSVSRPTVQAFVGSLEGRRAHKGILITTSAFTREAAEYVQQIDKRAILIDGPHLADLMIEHGVGVSKGRPFTLMTLDQDYFDEGE